MLQTILIRPVLRLCKIVISMTVFLMIVGLVGVMGGYFYFAHDLPNIQRLEDYKPSVVSEVFASDGTKIGEFWKQRRFLVRTEDIPQRMKQAFIAAEDARFYEHSGIDPQGIIRALLRDVQAGGFVQGASTITQQITRSILLTRERRLERKIREAILATRLERNLTKEQILTLYLNEIYLGNRSYGIKAAADNYFRKPLGELSLAETAMIAGLARAPAEDNPVKNAERAKRRQSYVIERMRIEGYISADEAVAAKSAPLVVYRALLDKEFNALHTPYFTEHVRRQLVDFYGSDTVYKGGLRVETTVDLAKYISAESALRRGLEAVDRRTRRWQGPLDYPHDTEALRVAVHSRAMDLTGNNARHIPARNAVPDNTPVDPRHNYRAVITERSGNTLQVQVGYNEGTVEAEHHKWVNARLRAGDIVLVRPLDTTGERYEITQTPAVQGAILSMHADRGEVRAMVGGYDYRSSEFNRATQALRQPGSSFKPFVYAAALDKGFKYHTPIADSPVAYQVGEREIWSPKNAGGKFSGVGPFLDHITYSRNVPTVKIGHAVGLHYVTAYVRKLGISSPLNKYLSMSLGANGAYLNEVVRAYATFPNLGRTPGQVFVTKVTNARGRVLREIVSEEFSTPSAQETTPEDQVIAAGLRESLWRPGQHWIHEDSLELDNEELHVLYGNKIPEGYTITPQTAHLVTGLLQSVVARGTGRHVASLGKAIAGKTGTTNGNTDTWFVGYTPEVVTGVWVGYDQLKKIGYREEGGKTAAPIWRTYMAEAAPDLAEASFAAPAGLEQIARASLTGGSAEYWERGIDGSIAEEAKEIAERRMNDRAVNFFEEDLDFEEM